MIGVVIVVGCGIAIGVGVMRWVRDLAQQPDTEEVRAGGRAAEYNCQFKLPGGPWKSDEVMRKRMEANLGLSRQSPSNHFALFWKDYKVRTPTEGELLEQALSRLRKYLGANVEWERSKSGGEPPRLAGQPAMQVAYQGTDSENVPVTGECIILAYRGYAYWLFTWGPQAEKEQLVPEWHKLRDGLTVLNGREGWKEKPREKENLQGQKAAYQLTYPSDLWKERPVEEENDPLVDRVLEAFDLEKNERPHASKAVHFYVLVLPKAPDLKAAVTAAREHLVERLEKDNHGKAEMGPVKGSKGDPDSETDIGALHGWLLKLQVKADDTSSFERFYQVGVVLRPESTLVLLGDCPWERREFGAAEFSLIFQGLKAR
jgi:hypothetical protein